MKTQGPLLETEFIISFVPRIVQMKVYLCSLRPVMFRCGHLRLWFDNDFFGLVHSADQISTLPNTIPEVHSREVGALDLTITNVAVSHIRSFESRVCDEGRFEVAEFHV